MGGIIKNKLLLIIFILLCGLLFVGLFLLVSLRSFSDNPRSVLVNQNPSFAVSIGSQERLNKFVSDRLSGSKELQLVFTDEEFEVGVNDYWEDATGNKIFIGGSSISNTPENTVIKLSVNYKNVTDYGWSEENIERYLEAKFYESVFGIDKRGFDPVEAAQRYYDEVSDIYSENLFNVKI